jgi:hypothetical protein
MLDLPNAALAIDDLEQLGDWIDASTLLAPSGELSEEEIVDSLADSELLDQAPPKRPRRGKAAPVTTNRDLARSLVEDVWRCLRGRQRRLGTSYPIDLQKGKLVRRVASWQQARCFSFLLFSDLGKSYVGVNVDFTPGSDFCRLFEKVVEASESLLFRGVAVRFGHPPDPGWPVPVKDRIEHLAERFSRRADVLEDKIHGRDKDLGLDIAVRLALGDEEDGLLVLLTQCATGDNWTTKHEPSLDEWATLIRWKAVLVRAIAFPWRMHPKRFAWRDALRLNAVVLDRMRLLSAGNPDPLLDATAIPDIDAWCAARAAEFPRLS